MRSEPGNKEEAETEFFYPPQADLVQQRHAAGVAQSAPRLMPGVRPLGVLMVLLTKQQLDSAQEFATASIATLRSARGVHPGTVVAGTARMAGTYLFRSFQLHLPGAQPGQPVLSVEANAQGPSLIETAARLLVRIGIQIDPSRASDAVPESDQPTLNFLESQRLLEQAYAPIRARFNLSDEQAANAVAAATSLLIRHCAKALDPNIAFTIAAYGFVEGTKTAPDPVESSGLIPRST